MSQPPPRDPGLGPLEGHLATTAFTERAEPLPPLSPGGPSQESRLIVKAP